MPSWNPGAARHGERNDSRVEPLNRSRRRQSALILCHENKQVRRLTSAATRFMGASTIPQSRVGTMNGGARLRRALISNGRSEEHTSELQSRGHLVCRLLLEKKKNN